MAHSDHSAFDQFWLFWVVFYCNQFVAEGTSGSFSLCSLFSCMQVLRRDPICWRKTFHAWYVQGRERERCSQQPARQVWTCFAQHCWFRKGRSFEAEGLVMTSKMSLWFIQICGSSDLLGFEIAMQAHGQQSNPSTPEDWDSSTATFEVEYNWWCTIGAGLFWSCPDGAGCFSFVRQRVYASWQLLGAKKALECSIHLNTVGDLALKKASCTAKALFHQAHWRERKSGQMPRELVRPSIFDHKWGICTTQRRNKVFYVWHLRLVMVCENLPYAKSENWGRNQRAQRMLPNWRAGCDFWTPQSTKRVVWRKWYKYLL